jgi:hypothetical protein
MGLLTPDETQFLCKLYASLPEVRLSLSSLYDHLLKLPMPLPEEAELRRIILDLLVKVRPGENFDGTTHASGCSPCEERLSIEHWLLLMEGIKAFFSEPSVGCAQDEERLCFGALAESVSQKSTRSPLSGDREVTAQLLSWKELEKLCRDFGLTFDVNGYVEQLSANRDGRVDFNEFLSLTASTEENENAFLRVFKACGAIESYTAPEQLVGDSHDAAGIVAPFSRLRVDDLLRTLPFVPRDIVRAVLSEHSPISPGMISFEMFVSIMKRWGKTPREVLVSALRFGGHAEAEAAEVAENVLQASRCDGADGLIDGASPSVALHKGAFDGSAFASAELQQIVLKHKENLHRVRRLAEHHSFDSIQLPKGFPRFIPKRPMELRTHLHTPKRQTVQPEGVPTVRHNPCRRRPANESLQRTPQSRLSFGGEDSPSPLLFAHEDAVTSVNPRGSPDVPPQPPSTPFVCFFQGKDFKSELRKELIEHELMVRDWIAPRRQLIDSADTPLKPSPLGFPSVRSPAHGERHSPRPRSSGTNSHFERRITPRTTPTGKIRTNSATREKSTEKPVRKAISTAQLSSESSSQSFLRTLGRSSPTKSFQEHSNRHPPKSRETIDRSSSQIVQCPSPQHSQKKKSCLTIKSAASDSRLIAPTARSEALTSTNESEEEMATLPFTDNRCQTEPLSSALPASQSSSPEKRPGAVLQKIRSTDGVSPARRSPTKVPVEKVKRKLPPGGGSGAPQKRLYTHVEFLNKLRQVRAAGTIRNWWRSILNIRRKKQIAVTLQRVCRGFLVREMVSDLLPGHYIDQGVLSRLVIADVLTKVPCGVLRAILSIQRIGTGFRARRLMFAIRQAARDLEEDDLFGTKDGGVKDLHAQLLLQSKIAPDRFVGRSNSWWSLSSSELCRRHRKKSVGDSIVEIGSHRFTSGATSRSAPRRASSRRSSLIFLDSPASGHRVSGRSPATELSLDPAHSAVFINPFKIIGDRTGRSSTLTPPPRASSRISLMASVETLPLRLDSEWLDRSPSLQATNISAADEPLDDGDSSDDPDSMIFRLQITSLERSLVESMATVPLNFDQTLVLCQSSGRGALCRNKLRVLHGEYILLPVVQLLQRIGRGYRARWRRGIVWWAVAEATRDLKLWESRHEHAKTVQRWVRRFLAQRRTRRLRRKIFVRSEIRVTTDRDAL